MNLSDTDLNLLCAFDALYTEQSVTRASRRMGIGQPAMSDALRRMRVLFGDELFVRAAGAMQPTPRARTLAQELAPLLARMRAVMGEHVAFTPADSQKIFTIASTDFATAVLLPNLIEELRRTAPNVDLRITDYRKDSIGNMLDRGEVDVAIGVFPDPPQNMVKSTLFDERFVGLIRADHPALKNGKIDLVTFADLAHALVSIRRDERGAVDKVLQRLGLSRRIALVLPYMLLLPKVLATSDLVAILPARAATLVGGADLQCFALPIDMAPWSVEMLWSPTARTDKATAWLRDLIARTAKAL